MSDLLAWGDGIEVADGATDMGDAVAVAPIAFPVATASDVVITAVGGAFTAGTIKVTVHYTKAVAPPA